jgi:signal peptidase II
MRTFFFITVPLYALDQLTKWLVARHIEFEGEPHWIIPDFFALVHYGNTGAAFSSFSNSNAAFIVLSLVTLCVLSFYAWRGRFKERWMQTGVALLTAGVLGNLTDRLAHRHVIDFLLFDLHVPFAHPWPAFNVADSCICTAAGLFILASFFEKKAPVKSRD